MRGHAAVAAQVLALLRAMDRLCQHAERQQQQQHDASSSTSGQVGQEGEAAAHYVCVLRQLSALRALLEHLVAARLAPPHLEALALQLNFNQNFNRARQG